MLLWASIKDMTEVAKKCEHNDEYKLSPYTLLVQNFCGGNDGFHTMV